MLLDIVDIDVVKSLSPCRRYLDMSITPLYLVAEDLERIGFVDYDTWQRRLLHRYGNNLRSATAAPLYLPPLPSTTVYYPYG